MDDTLRLPNVSKAVTHKRDNEREKVGGRERGREKRRENNRDRSMDLLEKTKKYIRLNKRTDLVFNRIHLFCELLNV